MPPNKKLVVPEKATKPTQQLTDTGKQDPALGKGSYNREFGASGTAMIGGFINEDFNAALEGEAGLAQFEIMRKSDAQVFATLLACELPIRSTRWYVAAAEGEDDSISDQDREIADYVEENLFSWMENTWDDLLRDILTMLPMGFSLFERVFESDGQYIWLRKLGFRKQNSIQKWETESGAPGVTQILPQPKQDNDMNKVGVNTISIPREKLVVFSFRREGDNYNGVSILRSAYRHWFYKEKLYRLDAIRHERQAVGIPVIYMPASPSDEDAAAALKILQNIRSSESSYVRMPGPKDDGWLFEFATMHASDSTNLFESIKHHNREISKNVLAQFLELGDTESGSRSLSEDQSDLFLYSLTAIANQIADTFNRHIIPQIVDFNFSNVERYPKLKFDKLGNTDFGKLASNLASLAGSGLIVPDPDLEAHVRDLYDLPPKMEGAEDVTATNADEMGNAIDPNASPEVDPNTELDQIESDLTDLQASEDSDDDEVFEAAFSEMEDALEDAECTFAMPVSSETKQKISMALKAYWDRKGRKAPKEQIDKNKASHDQASANIDAKTAEYKKQTSSIRDSIAKLKQTKASIPKGKAGTSARKQLAAQVKEQVDAVKKLRLQLQVSTSADVATKKTTTTQNKNLNALLKDRRAKLREQIKGINEAVKTQKLTHKQAIDQLKSKQQANSAKIKSLISQGHKGKTNPNADMIAALRNENKQYQDGMRQIRAKRKENTDAAKAIKEKAKADSGLYTEETMSDEHYFKEVSALVDNQLIIKLQSEVTPEDIEALKKKGFRFNEFEDNASRPMTFAERKVNWNGLQKTMQDFEEKLNAKLDEITQRQKADLLIQVKNAVEKNDVAALGSISAKYKGELSQAISEVQKEVFEYAKQGAAKEMSVSVPPTKKEVAGVMRVKNDLVVDKLTQDIENAAKSAATQQIGRQGGEITATNATQAVTAAGTAIDKVLTKMKPTANTIAVTGSIHMGRGSVFGRYPEKVYAMQYSAIIDQRTTDLCKSLDGRIVAPGSSQYINYSPPQHYNCRSVWVEILQDEAFKPDIGGIPDSITPSSSVDDYTAPKGGPILLKNSPAMGLVKQELADREAKLEALPAGKFENRRQAHQKRIDELKKAISDAENAKDFSEYIRAVLEADGINFKE